MSITTLLALGFLGVVFITVGLAGLNYGNRNRIHEVEESIKALDKENLKLRRDIRILKERAATQSDRVIFVTDLEEPKQAPKYGEF